MKNTLQGINTSPELGLVIFSHNTDFKWLKFLKPGFRHCFALLQKEGQWVLYDPLSHQTQITILPNYPIEDLETGFLKHNCHVIRCTINTAPKRLAPIGPYSCVEAVKRVIGIHNHRILTPWQLYKYLKSNI